MGDAAAVTSTTSSSSTPGDALSNAVLNGDAERVGRLIMSGVPIDSVDSDGFTPMQRCVVTGNVNLLRGLLAKGASSALPDRHGDTPLHFAAYKGQLLAARVLLEHAANPHTPNSKGVSAVAAAAEAGEWAMVLLIQRVVGGPCAPCPEDERRGAEARLARATLVSAAGMNAVPIKPPEPLALVLAGKGVVAGAAASVASAGKALFKTLLGKAPPPSAAAAPPVGLTDGNGLPPPVLVSGLDFSRGIIHHGALSKKRANKLLSWRPKYYVVSSLYGAVFFWTGGKAEVDGLIKKVRFETFHSITHLPDKKGGRRFNLRVATGRTMNLAADGREEALEWVAVIKGVAGRLMGALRIQAVWRGHRVRARARRDRARLDTALRSAVKGAGGGGAGAAPAPGRDVSSKAYVAAASKASSPKGMAGAVSFFSRLRSADKSGAEDKEEEDEELAVPLPAEGIAFEGELRKKMHSLAATLLAPFKTRFFVIHKGLGALVYYESKAKRNLGQGARKIPLLKLLSVEQVKDARKNRTAAFTVRLTTGKALDLEARNPEEAASWVAAFKAVLIREMVAALRIQARWRGHRVRKGLRGPAAAAIATATVPATVTAASTRGAPEAAPAARVPAASPASAPRERWMRKADPAGKNFFFNPYSGATSWELPACITARTGVLLKGPYFSKVDGSGKKYYVHADTSAAVWDPPAGYVSEEEDDAAGGAAGGAGAMPGPSLPPPPPPPPPPPTLAEKRALGAPSPLMGVAQKTVSKASSGKVGANATSAVLERDAPTSLRVPRLSVAGARCGAFLVAARERLAEEKRGGGGGLPAGWLEVFDERSGRPAFFHGATGASTFTRPTGAEKFSPSGEAGGVASGGSGGALPRGGLRELAVVGLPTPRAVDQDESLTLSLWLNNLVGGHAVVGDGGTHAKTPVALDSGGDGGTDSPRAGGGDGVVPPLAAALADGLLLAAAVMAVVGGDAARLSVQDFAAAGDARGRAVVAPVALAAALATGAAAGVSWPRHVTPEALEARVAGAGVDAVWALARAQYVGSAVRELAASAGLCAEGVAGEAAGGAALLALQPPETLLLRWVSSALAGSDECVDGFGAQWADGRALCALVRAVVPPELTGDVPAGTAAVAAAGAAGAVEAALSAAFGAGVPPIFTVKSFTSGNARVQALFFGALAGAVDAGGGGAAGGCALSPLLAPGPPPGAAAGVALAPPSAHASPFGRVGGKRLVSSKAGGVGCDDAQQSAPARLVCAWASTLGLQGLYLPVGATDGALAAAAADGVLLLRLLDAAEPGSAAWGMGGSIYVRPLTPAQCRANVETALTLAVALELPGAAALTPAALGASGAAADAGKVVALLLAIARAQLLGRVSRVAFGGVSCDEAAVLAWANERIAAAAGEAGCASGGSASGVALPAFSALAVGRPGGAKALALLLAGCGARVDWRRVEAPDAGEYLLGVAAGTGACLLPTLPQLQVGDPIPAAFFVMSLLLAALA